MTEVAGRWRIGTLATRVGVSETVLRAWETRYGLLQPARTVSGYRVYGPEDERRARAMIDARGRGVPAREAAAGVLAAERSTLPVETRGEAEADHAPDARSLGLVPTAALTPAGAVAELHQAMTSYDSATMHAVLDTALASMSVESVIRDVLLPFMQRVGDGWESGMLDVADEHFASDVVRGRLAALSATAGADTGPLALLACAPHESHDIALKAFEVVLQRAGWRTRYLGPSTPIDSLRLAADIIEPDVVVLCGSVPSAFSGLGPAMGELASRHDVVVAGRGADVRVAQGLGARLLCGDPVEAAGEVIRSAPGRAQG